MPIAPGTRLGQYEVQEYIGQGAMGVVYRAYHPGLERTGAVKVMQAITPDADTVARFRHEAKAVAQMRHPNIVNVYDFGEFEGAPYMVVEFVPGGNLASRMSEDRLDRATALRYLRGIASGLDYAHRHNIVHRDVKPANVLLTEDDTPVLADFGLAKLMQGSSVKSMTGVTTGTPAYMAPEQVTGSGVGPPADRYSLATIAYEMLTGVIPFDGEALMELLYAQVHREPPVPSWRNPSLGTRVDAVIMRGLAKDPSARWESCTAFVDALAGALEPRRPVEVGATVVMTPSVASTVPVATAAGGAAVAEHVLAEPEAELATIGTAYPSPPPVTPPRQGRRKRAIALLAVGLILLLGVGGVVALFVLNPPATVAVTPDTVVAGDTVVVSASHVPPNTSGEIQLWSSVARRVAFRADGDGNASVTLDIPRYLEPGDHQVEVCWNGTCHAHQVIHVTAPVAITSPSPSPTVSPSPSHSPTPSSSPTSSAPFVEVLQSTVKPGDSETVGGRDFPGTTVALYFVQGSTVQGLGTATVGGGRFLTTVRIPSTARAGAAAIRVCYTGGCAFATINVA